MGVAKPRQRRKDARPGELMAAALEVFAEHGFTATRLEEVARRAGVSKGTVYLYFESKEALFKAAVEAAMTPALEAAEALAADATKSSAELLRCFVFGWWQMVGSTTLGGLPKLLVAESANFPELARWFHDNMIKRAQRAVAGIIELGVARGDFRPMPPMVAARIVFGPMFSYLLWQRAFGACMADLPDPETYFSLTVDMLVHGLAEPRESV
ncbi:MAG TPA: TetR/AcrR family transcriptional regulator [Rhodocyclaceae bacterium]|nr:TetR/AcrR family transcriptional regulator [Rhodocyclaceae bacterium]